MSHTPHPPALSEAPAVWHQGLTVGRYSLLSRIAVGGMAEIWLARQVGPKGFEKFVVIKRILDGLGTDPEFVGMFLDEARIAAQLNHPHIVQIFDLGEEAGAFYIAMEYLPCENLATIARTGAKMGKPLPIPYAVRIVADIAEGLAYAHAKTGPDGALLGIVHRDVSPQNLVVTYDGVVKVLDFGIAKAASRESATMAGQVKGKAAYMSPEQARGGTIDPRSDIFSLGIILFEVVTRSRLFQFSDQFAALAAVAGNDPIPLAHERNPAVPEDLSRIIAQALARDPTERFSTARHFQNALEEWLRAQPEVPGSAELASYMGQVFEDRIQERARLLEAARAGDLTPSVARRVAARSNTADSMPSRPIEEETTLEQPWRPRPQRLMFAGAAVLLLLASVAVFFALRPAPAPPPPPPQVVVVQPEPPPPPPEPPAPPVLTIETVPPGAMISVNGEEMGEAPLTLDTLALGEHTVVATLKGRKDASGQVTLSHPGERATLVLQLPLVPPKPTPVVRTRPAAPPGKLTLDTSPWTRVFLRGRKLGDTPLIDHSLPAGRHQLKLINEEKKISTIIEVEIRSGQTTSKKLRL